MSHTSRRDLDAKAQALGFSLAGRTKRNHLIYAHPQVRERVTVASSASDWRSIYNALAMMRRLLKRAGVS